MDGLAGWRKLDSPSQLAAFLCSRLPLAMISLLIGCASSPMVGSVPSLVDQPRLEVTPSSVNFSSAIVGVQTSQTLKLSNTGEAALTVTGVIASGAGLSINGFSGSTLLSPGTSSTLTVNFTPKATGTFTGSVSVLTNTPSVTAALPVSGDVANANLAISVGPSSLSFGTVTAGKTASQNVKLTNTGNTDVTVSSIKVSVTGFSVTGWSSAVQLEPSQSTTVDVQFDPKNSGNYTGSLIVVSDASDSSVAVPLSGVVEHELGDFGGTFELELRHRYRRQDYFAERDIDKHGEH